MTALVVAPHPDDEVLGCSSVLHRASVTVVHVTDGVPPWIADEEAQELRDQRVSESLDAWAALSSKVERVRLGFSDLRSWQRVADVAPELAEAISSSAPEVVYLPAYQAGHPDHDASYLAGVLARAMPQTAGVKRWSVYGLYGFDDERRVRFGWLPPALYGRTEDGPIEERGDSADFLRTKADALRRFVSQMEPGSALDLWVQDPAPERFAPVPPIWDRLPSLPCYYEEELGFAEHGASGATVAAALATVLPRS